MLGTCTKSCTTSTPAPVVVGGAGLGSREVRRVVTRARAEPGRRGRRRDAERCPHSRKPLGRTVFVGLGVVAQYAVGGGEVLVGVRSGSAHRDRREEHAHHETDENDRDQDLDQRVASLVGLGVCACQVSTVDADPWGGEPPQGTPSYYLQVAALFVALPPVPGAVKTPLAPTGDRPKWSGSSCPMSVAPRGFFTPPWSACSSRVPVSCPKVVGYAFGSARRRYAASAGPRRVERCLARRTLARCRSDHRCRRSQRRSGCPPPQWRRATR